MDMKAKISALGGVVATGRLLGVPPTTVHGWYKNNRAPHWRQPAIDAALAALASLEDLTPPFPRAR